MAKRPKALQQVDTKGKLLTWIIKRKMRRNPRSGRKTKKG